MRWHRWRPPKRISFKWLHDLLRAMAFLHGRDPPLIHRDIKASNMFCSADLTNLKLGDFGLCRPVRPASRRCASARSVRPRCSRCYIRVAMNSLLHDADRESAPRAPPRSKLPMTTDA